MSFTKITWVLKSGRILRSYVQLLLARISLKIFHKEIAINIVFPLNIVPTRMHMARICTMLLP